MARHREISVEGKTRFPKAAWDPFHLVRVYQLAKEGFDVDEVADAIGVAPATLKTWFLTKEGIKDAFERGKGESEGPTGWPHLTVNQRKFLVAYSWCGVIYKAAEIAQLGDSQMHYTWIYDDEYKKAFKEADRIAKERILLEARRRAVDGVARVRFHNGRPIMIPCEKNDAAAIEVEGDDGTLTYVKPYVEHQYSDALMAKFLDAYIPAFRREQRMKVEHSGSVLSVILDSIENDGQPKIIDVDVVKKAAEKYLEHHGS